MRKIILFILLFCFCKIGVGQWTNYPVPQNLGNTPTTLVTTNSIKANQGFILGAFADTSSANALPYLANYIGAMVWSNSDSSLYVRYKGLTSAFWFKIGGAGAGPTGSFWNLNGNFVAVPSANFGIGTNDPYNSLPIKTNGTTRVILPLGGLALSNDTTNTKIMTWNPTTKAWGYSNWNNGSGGSAGWLVTGNSGTSASTNWVGTNDNVGLRFKTNNADAGYISNSGFGGSGIVPDYTNQYLALGKLAGYTLTPLVIAGTSTGRSNVFYGPGAGAWVGATFDTTAGSVSGENTFIGLFSGGFTQRTNFTTGTGRNVWVGMSTGFHAVSPGENTGVGTFVHESVFRPTKNTSMGSNSLRTGNDAFGMSTYGAYSSAYSGTIVASVTINSSSSDWTTATATFSAPWSTGSPGDCRVTATGTVTIAGGQITGIVITNPGCGYTDISGSFSASLHNTRPIVTITGDGTSVSATVNTISATNSSSFGHTAGYLSRAPQNMLYLGASSEATVRYWDALGGAIGYQAGIHSSISPLQKMTNAWAVGTRASVSTDRTFVLGAPVGDSTLKFVLNNHTGDSIANIYGGGLNIASAGGGLKVTGLASPFTGNSIPMVSSTGSFTPSIITQDVSSAIVRIDDNVRGVTTTNNFPFIVRNSYPGTVSSNAESLVLFSTNSNASTQKYILRMSATSMPDGSDVTFGLGKTPSTRDIFYWTYRHVGTASTSNYLEHQFQGVGNVMREYADRTITMGGISGNNGYGLELAGTFRNHNYWETADISLPSTPASGFGRWYVRADSARFINDAGTEFTMGLGSGGSGTVTSFAFTDGSGFDGTVTNATTTPTLALTTTVTDDQLMISNSGGISGSTGLTYTGSVFKLTASSINLTQGADVASAAGAIALGNDGNTFEITGTSSITLISNSGWQNGSMITLMFTSTATLVDGTANSGSDIGMELSGNENFTAVAGDIVELVLSEIGGTQRWRQINDGLGGLIIDATGVPIASASGNDVTIKSLLDGTSIDVVNTSSTTATINFAPGGTTAQYIRGDGSLATFTGGVATASNGLTVTSNDVKLGGALTGNTSVTGASRTYSLSLTGFSDMIIEAGSGSPGNSIDLNSSNNLVISADNGNLVLGSASDVITSNGIISTVSNVAHRITSSATTQTTTSSPLSITANSLTTGTASYISSSSLTAGSLLSLVSTSTALAANNEGLNIAISGANGTNAITATGATISVLNTNGTSGTNVGIDITASGATTNNLHLLLREPAASGTNYTAFKTAAQAGDIVYTLPDAYPAVSGYILSSTDAGVMSWVADGGGGGSTWNGITDPTGTQALTFGDAELTTWANGSNTETFLAVTSNSLTTGKVFQLTSSSITSGNLLELISTSTALASGNELFNIASSGANGSSSITTTGIRISITNTGTTSVNTGLEISASGATTNTALSIPAGNVSVVGQYSSPSVTLTDGATVTWDWNAGTNAVVTLGGNRTLSITNMVAGTYGTLVVIQDGTGSRTLAMPGSGASKVVNGGAGVVTLTTTAAAQDVLNFFYNGSVFFITYGRNFN